MMSRKTWSSISVYDFFRTYNWTGESIDLELPNVTETQQETDSLLSLNLQSFLLRSNWAGKQKRVPLSPSIQHSKASLLSLSVKKFCQEIEWKGLPNVAPISNNSSSVNLDNLSSKDLDLDNLSDLF
ncbi:hypothetical protein [Crocosphaera sp.]|uniref:hypothetical protein n=1 Tax=Crocosphaera sp. TaxID=2729996 RepID=UPI003F24C2B4|nr:hypothetical protein [Crocosphaera sp.]